ncbi:penicillin-binding protein [Bacillus pseudomycoides]|uniref:Penicillin-binding protein 1A n=2 Tax=Bacillus TaxID=1386 RepID=A0AA91VAG7_9BACI|nr:MULTISPECIES: PBP1A family penicillin-binding protein [Bacillus]PEB48632.1 penicillin-binding protein [Bacillus sp. AFS098217]PED81585.1 penicillin-binding protein [Bacillus pseudomycoides]PEU07500.1 penicillin-binding protein [Bacillus sp. AFS019443]PEU10084.1 penicillin-binding protein [Bacillus sp. AFS014408]PFW62236.1 penicillin-binding protein [Bacillus sp. AFS075034]
MSENYRSREERRQVQKKKQPTVTKGKTKEKAKSKGKTSFFRKFLIGCLILGIVALVGGVTTFFIMIKDAPKLEKSKLVNPLSAKIYDKDGKLIYEYGKEKRTEITYDQVPKLVENAFLATEDARFYEHSGVDFKGTARAVLVSLTGNYGSQGGSTITQQVIKNYFLSMDKTAKRKAQEIYLAYKLEQQYSKHEILEMYLNKINLGNRSYGIATAAENYYGKELKDLTLPEAAMLAGLPKGPSIYDPTKPENVERATERRNVVLHLMNRHGYISKEQMEEASKVPVDKGLLPAKQVTEMPYPAFIDAVMKEVEKELPDVNIGSDGLSIYTTLDQEAQKHADKILNENIIGYPNDQFQGAFTFMDTKTGEVRAVGSGRGENKATFKGHNMAIELERSVGSTMKPIFDYGPAIEYLKWPTYHQLDDSPYKYSTGQQVQNADKSYKGMMTMRDALKMSRNIPAIKTAKEVGLSKAQGFAESLGIPFDKAAVESNAIGSNEASPTEVAGAYAAFGNGGKYIKPHFVRKVVYPDGKSKSFEPKAKVVMQDYTAYMITDMLRSVVSSGTGTAANVSSLDVAGKTGTTNYSPEDIAKYHIPSNASRDSWFAGYTPQYTMAVWTGYMKNSSENYISSKNTKIAQLIFKEMMGKFGTSSAKFKMPSSVVQEGSELRVKGAKSDSSPNPSTSNSNSSDQKQNDDQNKQQEQQQQTDEQKKQQEQQNEENKKNDQNQDNATNNQNGNGQGTPPSGGNGNGPGSTNPPSSGNGNGPGSTNPPSSGNGNGQGNPNPPSSGNGNGQGNPNPPSGGNGSGSGNPNPPSGGSGNGPGNPNPPSGGNGNGQGETTSNQ